MDIDPIDEHAYLIRRAADHRRQAGCASDPAHQNLHEQFAALYEARARSVEVQDY